MSMRHYVCQEKAISGISVLGTEYVMEWDGQPY